MRNGTQSYKQSNVLHFNLKILHLLGYWMPESYSGYKKVVYRMYTFTVIGLMILHAATEIAFVIIKAQEGNVTEVANGSYVFFLNFTFIVKVWFLVKYKHEILRVIETMDKDIFKPINREQKLQLQNHLQNMVNFCYIFVIMGVSTCILFGVFPFTDPGELKLPLGGWYPFQKQLFVVLYAYQLTQETSLAMCNISIDCINICLLDHMCNQVKMLNNKLKFMKKICQEKLEKKKSALGELVDYKRELQKLMDNLLVECINHYRYVLRMKRDLEEIFGMGIFIMFMFDCIALCMTMFQLLIISFKSIQFFSVIIYMMCITTELMAYCWFGNELLVVSSQVSVAAYESDWTDTPVYFQKNLLMFITIAMKPMKVTVVHLILSVETFTAIMRTAWSYFVVLRQKYNEEK